MQPQRLFASFLICGVAIATSALHTARAAEIPRIEKRGAVSQLIVDGRPFLVLGGELHNSTSSSLEYTRPIWPKLVQMNLNTVLAVVSWDLIEPREGKFDFALVDGLIEDARRNNLRLALLWFGSWKNGLSHYVPDWVKLDAKRYPRAKLRTGTTEVLSPVSDTNREADARAFAAFMKHLRSVDEKQRTVIMIQVENEVGLLGDSRDRSEIANDAFGRRLPKDLTDYLHDHKDTLLPEFRAVWQAAGFKTSGDWEDVFGKGAAAEEIFMAWHYANYVGRVAEAGKGEYPLPMFVNAWIVQPEDKGPGDYPSGGPQAHMLDVWRAGAPKIDVFTPDIYLPNFAEVCAQFTRSGNALFVPESRAGTQGVANAFVAIGQYGSIGYSPFGIESRETDPLKGPLHFGYETLKQLSPLILEHQNKGSIAAVSIDRPAASKNDKQDIEKSVRLGDYTLTASLRTNRRNPADLPERGYALMIALGRDEYLVVGGDVQITFAPATPGPAIAGLATVEEGNYVDGKWVPGRTLNGDEIMISYEMANNAAMKQTGTGLRFQTSNPTIQRVKLYRYE